MSLLRYENNESLVQLNEPQYGQLFTDADLRVIPNSYLVPDDPNFLSGTLSQLHIYSFYGDYIAGDHSAEYLVHDPATNSMLIDVSATFRGAGINRGSYIIVVNLLKQLFGQPEDHAVIIDEISPDRTELRLVVRPEYLSEGSQYRSFVGAVESLSATNVLNSVVMDFGFNRLNKILLVKYGNSEVEGREGVLYVKLYKPIADELVEKDTAWFGFETADPYVDTVILTTALSVGQTRHIRGANYDIDADMIDSNATVLKSWNDLLDTDTPTAQRIIDMTVSGSASARLNIDYTSFENFIFYSSAEERLENFKYKLQLIEDYNTTIDTLQASTASNTAFISSSVTSNQGRIDTIVSTLDHFERWLYYDGTGSIFTHDKSGSLTPYPKSIDDGKYVLSHTTSSLGATWLSANIASASAYDQTNTNRLWWSVPEHVVMDAGSSEYVAFVDMIGQHFDNLYAYIKALTSIHERDEHPERGISNDLLWHVAKSFGWNLQNARASSELWKYKLGTSASGSWADTGSMFSLSHENQTQQIWRRIVNNLPYLLKTKGTSRSVKALMSIYGIPQTLISIKEYGGPAAANDRPQLIEDRFGYALNFAGAQHISMPRGPVPTSSGSWDGSLRVPDTIEFRFKTNYSGSVSQSMWSIVHPTTDEVFFDLSLVHAVASTATASYSGSKAYGYMLLGGSDATNDIYVSSSYLPMFDNDWWTVRIWTGDPLVSGNEDEQIHVEVAKASDCTDGEVSFSSSFAWTPIASTGTDGTWGSDTSFQNSPARIIIGGMTGSNGVGVGTRFSGSMQNYKEYFEVLTKATFDEHVLNPGAYYGNNSTSSFYNLYRYFPLGSNAIREDHSVITQVSSSHPNTDVGGSWTTASFHDFTGDQTTDYISFREQHYIYTPSLGGHNIRNKKIRVEESRLLADLSPSARNEVGNYDRSTIDTNRLAIVFSLADQINRDIFNHMGFEELGYWFADPQYEFESEYAELKRFGREYWQKYKQKNDINAFINILSVYDYTFFEQIKQLTPGRADLIAGILIEPHVLERSKVRLTERPTVTNPQYSDVIGYPLTQSGVYRTWEGDLDMGIDTEFTYHYESGSIDQFIDTEFTYHYESGSIGDPVETSASSIHHLDSSHQRTGLCGVVDVVPYKYTGSLSTTGSMVVGERWHHRCKYYKVIFHYSSSGNLGDDYYMKWLTAVSMSCGLHYSRSLVPTGYQIDECSSRNNSRFIGSKMTSADFNVDSPDTVDGGPVVHIIESNPNSLFIGGEGEQGNLLVD